MRSLRGRPGSWKLPLGMWGSLAACGCNLNFGTDNLENQIQDGLDGIADIEICDGMTLEELQNSVTISEGCKAELESYLPEAENNFSGRLIVFGQSENADGSLSVYLQGVDEQGLALAGDAWANLAVSVNVSGALTLLGSDDYSLKAESEFSGDLLSVGFVNDYSGSMSVSDIRLTAEIEQEMLSVLPDIVEGEVTLFSTSVEVKQTFVSDRDLISAAVAYDESFERDMTALYDGMGVQLDSLSTRERPLRLLVVATDGQENSSLNYDKAGLIQKISDEGVCVLILGSLFSEPDELEEFAGHCGAYFYTPGYADLKAAVSEYTASLQGMIEVTIPAAARGEAGVSFQVAGLSASVE